MGSTQKLKDACWHDLYFCKEKLEGTRYLVRIDLKGHIGAKMKAWSDFTEALALESVMQEVKFLFF